MMMQHAYYFTCMSFEPATAQPGTAPWLWPNSRINTKCMSKVNPKYAKAKAKRKANMQKQNIQKRSSFPNISPTSFRSKWFLGMHLDSRHGYAFPIRGVESDSHQAIPIGICLEADAVEGARCHAQQIVQQLLVGVFYGCTPPEKGPAGHSSHISHTHTHTHTCTSDGSVSEPLLYCSINWNCMRCLGHTSIRGHCGTIEAWTKVIPQGGRETRLSWTENM
jgi:hypothetical protein